MERDLFPLVPESTSKVQDRMGDVHSKDFEHLNSSQRQRHQVDSKQSPQNCLKCSSPLMDHTDFNEFSQEYSGSTPSDKFVFVDIAVKALEDPEISKENGNISYIKPSNDLLLPEGSNTSQLIFSYENGTPKAIQQIDSEENGSTEKIQPFYSVETEFTEEIQTSLSVETEFTKEIHSAFSGKNESTEIIQPIISMETESTEEIQASPSVETESTEEIQASPSVETESTEETQPSPYVEAESSGEIQPSLSAETESTKGTQSSLSLAIESHEEIQPSLSVEAESTEGTSLSVETNSTGEIQRSLSVEAESPEEIQPSLSVEAASTERTQPSSSVEAESTEGTSISVETDSTEEIQPFFFVGAEFTGEIQPNFSMETDSTTETQPSETKSTRVIQSAMFIESEVIQTPASEGIPSTIIIQPVSFEKTESIHPVNSETKLTKVKEQLRSEKFPSNEAIELHSLDFSEYKKSQISLNDTNPLIKTEVLSKIISEIHLHFSNLEKSKPSFPPVFDTPDLLSLLNTEEYKNASYHVYVNDRAGCGAQIIVTPTSPLPEPIFPNLVMPPLSRIADSFPMRSNENPNRSSESIQPIDSRGANLITVKPPVISKENNLNEIAFNSLVSSSIEKANSSSQTNKSSIATNYMNIPADSKILSIGLSESSNSEGNSNSHSPAIDTKSFISSLNIDEYKNVSQFGVERKSYVNESGGHVIFTPTSPLTEPPLPSFAAPPIYPNTECHLLKTIENLSLVTSSNQMNPEAAFKVSNSEGKSNLSALPVSDNERIDSLSNIKEYNDGKPIGIPGKGRMAANISPTSKPSPYALNFKMIPSPPAKKPLKKSAGKLSKTNVAIDPADIPCEKIFPNSEVPSLSPPAKSLQKSIKELSPTEANTVPQDKCHKRVLSLLLNRLADWIYRGMEKFSLFFERSISAVEFVKDFRGELENGIDLLTQMEKHVDTLVKAAEGLPDPSSRLPCESGSERFSIRDRLVSAGILVLYKLENMKEEVISDRHKLSDIYSMEAESRLCESGSLERQSNAHAIIFKLYVKMSEQFLKLSKNADDFRNQNRYFCHQMVALV